MWCPGQRPSGQPCKSVVGLWDGDAALWRVRYRPNGKPSHRYGFPTLTEFECSQCGYAGNGDAARDAQLAGGSTGYLAHGELRGVRQGEAA